jgi:hypothetical protein
VLANAHAAAAQQITQPRPSPANSPRRASILDVAARAGLATRLSSSSAALTRFGIDGEWWPEAGQCGAGVSILAGPPTRLIEPQWLGHLNDTAASAAFFVRSDPRLALRVAAGAGAGLHAFTLDGRLSSNGAQTSSLHAIPALELALHADWWIASEWFVGVRGREALLLHGQRYLFGDASLSVSRALLDVALAIGVSLPE